MPLLLRRETTWGFIPGAHVSGDRKESPRGIYKALHKKQEFSGPPTPKLGAQTPFFMSLSQNSKIKVTGIQISGESLPQSPGEPAPHRTPQKQSPICLLPS